MLGLARYEMIEYFGQIRIHMRIVISNSSWYRSVTHLTRVCLEVGFGQYCRRRSIYRVGAVTRSTPTASTFTGHGIAV